MAPTVRTIGPPRGPEHAAIGRRRHRRRWRFRPRGLIGVVLASVLAINVYVLADGLVRLAKLRLTQAALARRLAQRTTSNRALKQQRNWMRGTDFLRDQAHNLGYVAPGESASAAAEEATPSASSPVKRRNHRPCQPY